MSLSNKSDFYDFTPARSVSDGGDFYFLGLVRQALYYCYVRRPYSTRPAEPKTFSHLCL